MKKYNKYEFPEIENGHVADLMVHKQSFATKKKPLTDNYGVYSLLSRYLSDFGIYVLGHTSLWDESARVEFYPQVLWVKLFTKKMPIENLQILAKIYPWKDAWLDVGLTYEGEECDYSLFFCPDTGGTFLRKHVYGNIDIVEEFDTIEGAVGYFNKNI
ncbi:MAG TPA: hypothetical protein PKA53_03720 [Sphingobacterium sp.]|nr:hypothetical protein [Sphingobacterium sp.]